MRSPAHTSRRFPPRRRHRFGSRPADGLDLAGGTGHASRAGVATRDGDRDAGHRLHGRAVRHLRSRPRSRRGGERPGGARSRDRASARRAARRARDPCSTACDDGNRLPPDGALRQGEAALRGAAAAPRRARSGPPADGRCARRSRHSAVGQRSARRGGPSPGPPSAPRARDGARNRDQEDGPLRSPRSGRRGGRTAGRRTLPCRGGRSIHCAGMERHARAGREQCARLDATLAPDLERSLRDALAQHSEIRWAYLFGSCAAANQRALDIEPWLAEAERLRNEALRQRAG